MTSVRGVVLCAVLCALAVTLVGCGSGSVTVDEPSMPSGVRETCRELVTALPGQVADEERREIEPGDALGAAWGDPAIVLRCGVDGPAGYDPANGCTSVNGVDWYIPVDQLEGNGEQALTMTTIKRDVAVEVTMPGDYWPPAATLADLSTAVAEHTERTGRCL